MKENYIRPRLIHRQLEKLTVFAQDRSPGVSVRARSHAPKHAGIGPYTHALIVRAPACGGKSRSGSRSGPEGGRGVVSGRGVPVP